MFRRLTALFLALCFSLFSIEGLIADVHDGDVTVMQRAANAERAFDAGHASLETARDEVAHTHEGAPSTSGHSFHVCHASHLHVGLIPTCPDFASTEALFLGLAFSTAVLRIDDVRQDPGSRPPIA